MLDMQGFDAYKNTSVQGKAAGANVHKLVLMLFEGFLEELDRAEGHIEAKRFEQKAKSVERLLKILGGLEASLDPANTSEIVTNMKNLYQYCGQTLMTANIQNDVTNIGSVRKVMTDLLEGWQGIVAA